MKSYRVLAKQVFSQGKYSLVPIRPEDRYNIMQWRNEQIYHLRQDHLLEKAEQDHYFSTVVASLFEQEKPSQILFSFLENGKCVGYGGMVHINWNDKHAELSFLMNTSLEGEFFAHYWSTYLALITQVAFEELRFHKIYTYAFDVRKHLYGILEDCGFRKEAVLKEHCLFEGKFIDVIIHSRINSTVGIRKATAEDAELTFRWASDPAVRKYSFNQSVILWENHQRWFSDKLQDPACEYLILYNDQSAIGSIRFDVDADGAAMISFLIDPACHGRGYGSMILERGIEYMRQNRRDVKRVYGFVVRENVASVRVFEKLDFARAEEDNNKIKFLKENQ